jgi:YrbI family 3-deoxy-D-manno-octulosonate 8-phosphate phosphatase
MEVEKMMKTMIPAIQKRLKSIKLLAMDFDGVVTDNMVWTFADGKECVASNRSDSHGLARLRRLRPDIKTIVISKETDFVVRARCEKLRVECYMGIIKKLELLKEIILKEGIEMKDVAFIGNDINDTECVNASGVGIAVADAYPEVKDAALIITRCKGGHGAIREIVDAILEGENDK